MTTPDEKEILIEVRKLADLKQHPKQSTYFADIPDHELDNLKDSIDRIGLQQLIEIMPDGTIIKGHQRSRAMVELGYGEYEVIVRYDLEDADETEIEEELIGDNLDRRQLTPLDIARCCKRLKEIEVGRKPGELGPAEKESLRDRAGERLGMNGRNLDRYLRVLDTPQVVQQAFNEGLVGLVLASKVASLRPQEQTRLAEQLCPLIDSDDPPAKRKKNATELVKAVMPARGHRNQNQALTVFGRRLTSALKDIEGNLDDVRWHATEHALSDFKSVQRFLNHTIQKIEAATNN